MKIVDLLLKWKLIDEKNIALMEAG